MTTSDLVLAVALVLVVVGFTIWMALEHRRIGSTQQTTEHEMHEWMLGGLESTNGHSIRAYVCERCGPRHIERREV